MIQIFLYILFTDTYKPRAFFGQGDGPIWLNYLRCTGNERSWLLDCAARSIGSYNCGHSDDIGVVCSGT